MIIDGKDYRLDLLFYHRKLKRLIAIDLLCGVQHNNGDETVSSTLVVSKSYVGVNTARILDNANVGKQLFLSGIDLDSYRPSDINVVDVLGRKMPVAVLNSNTLDLNNLKTGIYYLKIGANRPLGFRAR